MLCDWPAAFRVFAIVSIGPRGSTDNCLSTTGRLWSKRLIKLFPAIGDLKFEHAWSGTIAMTAGHVPKIVAFGPNAYACFGYSGRGIGPGTVFGTQTAIALLERRPEELPIVPIRYYSGRFTRVKVVYYALGATLVHAVSPPLR